MDIDRKIEDVFKSFEKIDDRLNKIEKSQDVKNTNSFGRNNIITSPENTHKKNGYTLSNNSPLKEQKNLNFSKSFNKSRNLRLNEPVKKEATYDNLYSFKTYFTQEKCCHPLHSTLNRVEIRSNNYNNNSTLNRHNSSNKTLITTKDSESIGYPSIKKSKSSLTESFKSKAFPFKTKVEQGTIDSDTKNIGEKLYLKGVLVRVKQEEKIENCIIRQEIDKVPSINLNSRRLVDTNSKTWFERLYPKHKIETHIEHSQRYANNTRKPGEYLNDQESRIYRKKPKELERTFDFHPKISIRSKTLAEKRGSAKERILDVKKKTSKNPYQENIGKMTYFLSSNSNSIKAPVSNQVINKENNENKVKENSKSVGAYLYEEADTRRKKKEEKIKLEKKNEEESFRETHTFRPDLSKSKSQKKLTEAKNRILLKSKASEESFYKRQERWKKAKDNKNGKIKEYFVNMEMENCTFQPNINVAKIADDEKFIKKNLSQIMDYVQNRKNCLDKYDKQKIYENKKFFSKSGNFTLKPTVPKEFNLTTSKLNRTFEKENDQLKKIKNSQDFRNKIKSEDFFAAKPMKKENSLSQ